jgi:ATP-binding cassette subfamily B protein
MRQTIAYAGVRFSRLAQQLRYLPRTLALVWEAASHLTVIWVLLLVAQGLLPVAAVYLTRNIVNALVVAIRTGSTWGDFRPAVIYCAWIAAVMIAGELLRNVSAWVRTAQSELVRDHIASLIHAKSVEVDLAFYDSPDFYDHLHRARTEASYRPVALIESLGSLVQNAITLIAMAGVLIPYGPILPLALILGTIPAFYVVIRSGRQRHLWQQKTTSDERRSWYYEWLLTSGENAAEIRLFGLGTHFRTAYDTLRRQLRSERLTLARQQALAEIAAALTALAATGGAVAWMLWRAIRGLVSLGDVALFYQAFNQGLGFARSLLLNVGQFYENSLYLGNLFAFLALQPQVADRSPAVNAPRELESGIDFRDVSFRYPDSDEFTLRDFNLNVSPGQLVAIVGPNGAGKSTLVKLLCRFYDPDAGSIELDGTCLRDIPVEQLRDSISVLFQSPIHYNATAFENIAYGDLSTHRPSAIREAAVAAGADAVVERLPMTYETHLGRQFVQGSELSFGEWQRIALARAFLRPAPILILDEPTSAMDPWAEIEWLDRLRQFARGRIVLMITHRFTTAMHADVIHVVSDGRVIESGTHDELLAINGRYAEGWFAQVRA